ncbi:FG-GAP repeat domain-containing protein [Halochromatium roseum]|uniref:FG-GAP repeat domain-containing protein n=1 Tax=Halochromatium roseum TaxID=391920 RepID=UPI0030842AF4
MFPLASLGSGRLIAGYTSGYSLRPRGFVSLQFGANPAEDWHFAIGPAFIGASLGLEGQGPTLMVAHVGTVHNGNTGCGLDANGTCTNDGDLATVLIDANGQEQIVRTIGDDNSGGPNGVSRHVLTDLDGDGTLELIGSVDHGPTYYAGTSALRVYSLNGTELARASLGQNVRTQFLVANIDGQGAQEIAANGPGRTLQVFDDSLNLLWETSADTGYLMLAADLDGDGTAELVTGDDQQVRIFDGQVLNEKWSFDLGQTVSRAITSDLDGDGLAELYVAGRDGRLTAYSFAP